MGTKLNGDYRNAGIALRPHYQYWVLPSVLVLDLRATPEDLTPAALGRVLFQAAETLAVRETPYAQVVLARQGKAIYHLRGEDFLTLGRGVRDGENPTYLLRTFPEKLYDPATGRAAFETWEGGLFAVAGQQMQDFNKFAGRWAGGIFF